MVSKKLKSIAKSVIETEIKSLKKLKNSIKSSFDDAVNEILNCKNGKVIVSGVGKSGIIAKKSHQLYLRWELLLFLLMQVHVHMVI